MSSLLMVLVDALRHDALGPEATPFLWEVAGVGSRGATQEIFAGQLRPAFFAGQWPNESGIGHLFCFDPRNSPFRVARWVPGWVDSLPRVAWWVRRAILTHAKRVEAARGHRASSAYCYLAEIPTRRLGFFAFSETRMPWEDPPVAKPGLLPLLSAHGMPWLHLGYPVADQRTQPLTEAALSRMRPAHRFVFLHYAELDWAGHTWGVGSSEWNRALLAIDASIRRVWSRALQLWDEPKLLVFADHGMVDVTGEVDVERVVDALGLRYGKDYVVFLDSTVARFWFFSPRARRLVEDALGSTSGGRWLNHTDLVRLHLEGGDPRNGEAFWVVEAGKVIMPSYFHRLRRPRGMHGYLPEVEENWGVLVSSDAAGPRTAVPLTEVFPLATTMLGLGRGH